MQSDKEQWCMEFFQNDQDQIVEERSQFLSYLLIGSDKYLNIPRCMYISTDGVCLGYYGIGYFFDHWYENE